MINLKQRITIGVASFAIAASTLGVAPAAAFAEDGADLEASERISEPAPTKWTRIAGENAYDTMLAIVKKGVENNDFVTGGTVVVATGEGYWDALAASSLAGEHKSPVVITAKDELSKQAKEALELLKPKTILVMGGPLAVSDSTVSAMEKIATTKRVYGGSAADTAVAISKELKSAGKVCIVATSDGYWDALSISPYSNSRDVPIFLTASSDDPEKHVLSDNTVAAIKDGGYERVVIVGGKLAVSEGVEKQLIDGAGISSENVFRVAGAGAIETSALIADFELEDMSTSHLSVATTSGYWDALTGASLAGRQDSILVLTSVEGDYSAINRAYSKGQEGIDGQIFGGELAVPAKTKTYLEERAKQAPAATTIWKGEDDAGRLFIYMSIEGHDEGMFGVKKNNDAEAPYDDHYFGPATVNGNVVTIRDFETGKSIDLTVEKGDADNVIKLTTKGYGTLVLVQEEV